MYGGFALAVVGPIALLVMLFRAESENADLRMENKDLKYELAVARNLRRPHLRIVPDDKESA